MGTLQRGLDSFCWRPVDHKGQYILRVEVGGTGTKEESGVDRLRKEGNKWKGRVIG